MKLVPGSIELVSPKILVFIGLPSSIIFFLIFHSSSLELKKERKGGRKKEEKKEKERDRKGWKERGREKTQLPMPMSFTQSLLGGNPNLNKFSQISEKIKMMFTGRRCESSCIIGYVVVSVCVKKKNHNKTVICIYDYIYLEIR